MLPNHLTLNLILFLQIHAKQLPQNKYLNIDTNKRKDVVDLPWDQVNPIDDEEVNYPSFNNNIRSRSFDYDDSTTIVEDDYRAGFREKGLNFNYNWSLGG